MAGIIIGGAMACFLLIVSGIALKAKEKAGGVICLVMGLVLIFGMGFRIQGEFPNGKPMELVEDGIYQVRIVHLRIPGDPNESYSVGVLLLKEEGKTDLEVPVYKKIPIDFFKAGDQKDLTIGQEMTIKLKLFTPLSYRKIEVVK